MANEHIEALAGEILAHHTGHATPYVRAVLNEALRQLDEFSVYKPFEAPREPTAEEQVFAQATISAALSLQPAP